MINEGKLERNTEVKRMEWEAIINWLNQDTEPQKSLVVMLCGIAGSGKTTLAKRLEKMGFLRLSIDEEVWRQYGQYDVDYPASAYAQLSAAVENQLKNQLDEAIHEKKSVVIDFSFWSKKNREAYRERIIKAGGQVRLLYLQASPDLLRSRLRQRAKHIEANAAFEITDTILEGYLQSFEAPKGEGELIIKQK